MKRLLCLMMSVMIGVLSASITAFAHDSGIDFVQELDEIEMYDRKCRYWWEMYNNNGIRAFEYRNSLRNGWLLSNSELIAVALGRA